MASPSITTEQDTDELFFTSHNPSSSRETLILLHGLFSSHREWDHLIPHLSDRYHLLIPDLPHHSRSRHVKPFTLQHAALKVSQLIERHATGGKAHVVGLSIGGFTTLELIRRHPETVRTAFVTGAAPFTDWQVWFARKPSVIHWALRLVMNGGIYRALAWQAGLKEHDELKDEMIANNDYELVRSGYDDAAAWTLDDGKEVAKRDKRVLVAAGDQGDNQEGARDLGAVLRDGGQQDGRESRAYSVKGACHGWDLQFPELFATAIRAWIEGQPLPSEFTELTKE